MKICTVYNKEQVNYFNKKQHTYTKLHKFDVGSIGKKP